MIEISPPPSLPPQVESTHPEHFTVSQLLNLHRQLLSMAPSGFIPVPSLIDSLQTLLEWTLDRDTVPESWTNMTRDQVGVVVI